MIAAELSGEANPFYAGCWTDSKTRESHAYYSTGAADRLDTVKRFDAAQCRAALTLPDLQKTVRTAVERRLRKLEQENAA